jgi:hypothetical protein
LAPKPALEVRLTLCRVADLDDSDYNMLARAGIHGANIR